jgi:hypothetical protein
MESGKDDWEYVDDNNDDDESEDDDVSHSDMVVAEDKPMNIEERTLSEIQSALQGLDHTSTTCPRDFVNAVRQRSESTVESSHGLLRMALFIA